MRGQVTEVFKIYAAPDKQLRIPVYQRNYDWQQKHCKQLLTDLLEVTKNDRPKHFFGAVVGVPESSWVWVVIDGQQRLTTVSLLMLALVRLVEAGGIECADPGLAIRIRRGYLVSRDDVSGEPKFRLKPVKDDATAYDSLFGPESEFIEASNVTANYRFFYEQVPRLGLTAEEVWAAITKLEVMHLDLEKHDDPQRIFESLNSTGLALSEADKVRNLVLMGLPTRKQDHLYEQYWNKIEKNVKFDTTNFLRWYLVTQTAKTPRINQVYEAFKEFKAVSEISGEELLSDVREYSVHYQQLREARTGIKEVDRRLRRLNIMSQEVVLPLLMPLLAEYRRGSVVADDFATSLLYIESYLFRRYICGFITAALNKIFATMYREIRRLRRPENRFADVLAYSLLRRSGSGAFPADEEFREMFSTRDMYHITSARRRYLFECLENLNSNDTRDIANGIEAGELTIEHVMPQSLTAVWRDDLGPDAENTHAQWVNRIANLTVTGYNSKYSNRPFEDKKSMESGLESSPYRLNAMIKQAERWSVIELEKRSAALTQDAMGYWPYPQTDFVPAKPQLPVEPLGTDTDFTNRGVVSVEFNGQDFTTGSWREVVLDLVRELDTIDHDRLFTFAKTSDWFTVSGPVEGRHEVVPGLQVYLHSSTRSKTKLLRDLLNHLGQDPDDVILTLHADSKGNGQAAIGEDEPVGAYSELMKFVEPLDVLTGQTLEPAETRQLRAEFENSFSPHVVSDPIGALGMHPATFGQDHSRIDNATPPQIFALITATQKAAELLDPDAMHRIMIDGTLAYWLKQLGKDVN